MRLLMLGIDHRVADLALRDQAGFAVDAIEPTLHALRRDFPGIECALLSTCNRTEFYLARPTHTPPYPHELLAWWAQHQGIAHNQLTAAATHHEQQAAVAHLFRVCCGLESQIVGESQIHHQIKQAFNTAQRLATAGPVLNHVFQSALASARNARRETGLGQHAHSIGAAAWSAIQTVFPSIHNKRVVCLGAGPIAKATLQRLAQHQPHHVCIVSRTQPHAQQAAAALSLHASQTSVHPWTQRHQAIASADVVICATGSADPVLTRHEFLQARKESTPPPADRPCCILDLAVPRDVDPDAATLPGVHLFNIDQLTQTQRDNPARAAAAQACQARLVADARACYAQIQHRDVGQLIRQLRTKLRALADNESQRAKQKFKSQPATTTENQTQTHDHEALLAATLDEFGHRLVNKILHLPLQQLDTRRDDGALGLYAASLRRLFDLEEAISDPANTPPSDPPPPVQSHGHDADG